jgi:GlpG protein
LVFLGINSIHNPHWSQLAKYGYFPEADLFQGKPWGLIWGAFVHIDMLHLGFNLYWLWIIGGVFERRLGSGMWLGFVLLAAFVSSGVQFLSGATGIGLSGVVYALFGFEWVARSKYPEFSRVVTDRLAGFFVLWGIACVPLTYFNVLNVGNLAHLGGLMFGLLVGAMAVFPKHRALPAAGLALLAAVSVLPLFWNPLSSAWVAIRINEAVGERNWRAAEAGYRRYLEIKPDSAWAYRGLSEIYGYQQNKVKYEEAVRRLRDLDDATADRVMEQYGDPDA